MNTPITYLIAHTPRSGAFWLCDVLARNQLGIPDADHAALYIGYGAALAQQGTRSIDAFFADRLADGGGVCGIKTDLAYLEHLAQHIKPLDFKASIFSHVTHYILLIRENPVEQAVSWYLAKHTGQWTQQDSAKHDVPDYDRAAIDHLVSQIHEDNQRWHGIIEAQGVEPLVIVYEEMVKFGGMLRTIKAVCKHLGMAVPKPLDMGSDAEKLDLPQQAEYVERYQNGE